MKHAIKLLTALLLTPLGLMAADSSQPFPSRIDRHAVVTRHNVTLTSFGLDVPRNKQSVLQVGNGHFAYGLDVTGLQTFMLHGSFGHATLSDWCWHTAATPEGYRPEDTWIEVASGGGRRTVPYAANSKHLWSKLTPEQAQRAEGAWNYLTAVNSTGSSPPQESGLFSNSWHGKFHLEMTAWHGVHFALWGRPQLVDGWMQWMRGSGLEAAKQQAARQGYQGARWMKMIAPTTAWESPSDAGPFRMTQQGHAIYWAELMYRVRPTRQTLEQFQELVQQSAEFMADYLWWDAKTGRYVLGPPLLTGSEASNWRTTCNSTVELS